MCPLYGTRLWFKCSCRTCKKCPFYGVSPLECPLWRGFVIRDSLGILRFRECLLQWGYTVPTEMLMQTRQGKSSKSLRFNFYVVLQPAFKRSRSQIFFKIGVLKSFSKFIGKHLHHRNSRHMSSCDFCDVQLYRSSLREVFCKKDVLTNFTKFTGKHMCQSLFFNKVAGLKMAKHTLKILRCSHRLLLHMIIR